MNLAHALQQARALGLERLDAQLLLLYALGRTNDRAWLFAHDTDLLSPDQADRFATLCQRRTSGEPLAYIVGSKEFFGLTLQVTPDVLVPRPDTETLVEWALECGDAIESHRASNPPPLRVIDLGTGSGAIALALKSARPHWHITGLDASNAALQVARNNGQALGLQIDWQQGNWLATIGPTSFDLIVSNPPYIAPGDPHLAGLQAEPQSALVAPDQGLADLATIITQARRHLTPGGALLLEHGYDQANAVQALLRQAGWQNVQTRNDLAGVGRCTGGWVNKEKPRVT